MNSLQRNLGGRLAKYAPGKSLIIPFLLGSLTIMGAAGFLFTEFSRRSTEEAVVKQMEQQAKEVALHINYWLAGDDGVLEPYELTDSPVLQKLVSDATKGLSIAKLHVFAADRTVLFSTDAGLVGTKNEHTSVFEEALKGHPESELERDYHATDAIGLPSASAVVETYVPLWKKPADAHGGNGEAVGVLEIYQDVEGALAATLALSNGYLVIAVGALGILFTILFAIVVRFEHVLVRSIREQTRLEARADDLSVAVVQAYNEQLQAANRELEDRSRQVEESSRFKTDFFANTSHELRSPLNAIIGYSDVLLGGLLDPLTPDQQDSVTEIRDSGNHLLALIGDILDTSKIEAGKLQIDQVPLDLTVVIANVGRTMAPLLAAKAHQLSVNVGPELPLVRADDLRVKQILLNLLSNAVKFTPIGGRLTITAAKIDAMIQVSVADDGKGIPAELLDTVFRKFERVGDKDSQKGIEGTGLGLPLARELARLHGGEMWCESEVGRGSTFFFTLPMAEAQAADVPAQPLAA